MKILNFWKFYANYRFKEYISYDPRGVHGETLLCLAAVSMYKK